MIGLDRTPGVLPALPASNFPWPMGDDSAPLTSTNIMARHTTKPDTSSPQRHSSLTPAPDSSSPNTKAEANSKSPENSNEDASHAGLVDDGGAPSPLSELSPAPEEDDEDDGLDPKEEGGDSKKDEGKPTGASNTPPRPNGVSKKHAAPNAEASSSSSPLRGSYPHQGEHSASSSRSALPGSAKRNRKIDALIQLNGELFKALDEFHSRSIPKDDKRFTEFNSRLHSNLTWLANAADNPQALVGMNSLPPLSTPQSVDFLPMDRILQLYKELGAAFAKDIARMRESAHHPPAQGPPSMIPGSLKRERPDQATPEPMNKRRDTGEHKTPMLPPSTPASMGRGFPPGIGGAPNTPQMAASSPSIPSQGFPMNTTQAEMQRRAAQLQMRGQQQAAAQRPTQTSPHQMQPPPVPGPGPSAGGNINAGNPAVQQVVAQFGQNGLRVLQMLQTPNQPVIQQILKNYPQFPTLSPMQQVQAVLRFTGALDRERQHAQQQQQQQQQHGVGGGMSMQGGQGGIPLSRMGSGGQPGAPMGVPSQGGPGGISMPPGGFTQAQLMAMPHQQRQMLMMQQQMRNGPGGGGNGGMQGGINPAAFGGGAGGPGGMQQGGINPAVFGPGGQGGVNPAILQQQQQRLMQQQAAQQQQHQGGGMGSPMHAGSPANDFGGMQRSTHSPSENAPSPMTPRGGPGGGGGADFQRMMAMQAAQANAPSPAPSNSGGGGGFINPQQMMAGGGGQGAGWQQQNSGSAGGHYGGTPPGSAHGRPQQQFPPSAPSPGAGGWPGSAGVGGGSGGPGGGYPYAPSPVHQMGGPQQQQRPPSRTASAAGGGFPGMDPGSSPGMGMSGGMDAGLGDFSEFFNTQSWS